MITPEVVRVALDAIWNNRLRSALTMLGIIIGIAAVIVMVALGEGAQRAVQAQIESLGTNVLTVRPGQGWSRGVRSSASAPLTVDDAKAVEQGAPLVEKSAPQMDESMQVQYGRLNANLRIVGTTPEFPEVNGYKLELGRFFDRREADGRRRVAVVGGAADDALGVDGRELVGRQIYIGNVPFEVIGLFREKGGTGWFNEDEQIWVPIETARFRLMGSERIDAIDVTVADQRNMQAAMMQIEAVLRRQHRLRPGQPNDFWIQNAAELMGTQQETTRTLGLLLAGIAAVSLIVGGIGIMNIMLVSVTERTREIGLRKALGARRREVLMQFLLEALSLCLLGGVLGILVGAGGAWIISSTVGWNTAVSPQAVGLAVVFAFAIGIFFGLWPARRAARLDPIVALRFE